MLIRSVSTGFDVRSTGSRYWPAPGSPLGILASASGGSPPPWRGSVSWHSMYFSPISDCGRIVHFASRRKSWKFLSVMSTTTAALLSRVTSSFSIVPTLTPETRTSSPSIRENALSKTIRTL